VVIAEHSGPAAWDITLNAECALPDRQTRSHPSCCAKPTSRRCRSAYRSNSATASAVERGEPVRFYLIDH
jgi:hypothetical protein